MGHGDCLRSRLAAVCGCNCELCDAYRDSLCDGCGYQLGQTRRGECAIFPCCVVEQGLEHCGLCSDFPCHLFMSQAHPLDVARRYRALCRRMEIGTIAWLDEQAGHDGPGGLPPV
jgi:hypothetical protein